jgi:hypothetical protein
MNKRRMNYGICASDLVHQTLVRQTLVRQTLVHQTLVHQTLAFLSAVLKQPPSIECIYRMINGEA